MPDLFMELPIEIQHTILEGMPIEKLWEFEGVSRDFRDRVRKIHADREHQMKSAINALYPILSERTQIFLFNYIFLDNRRDRLTKLCSYLYNLDSNDDENLIRFMQQIADAHNRSLAPSELNRIAMEAFFLLSQLEYPNSPLVQTPQIKDSKLDANVRIKLEDYYLLIIQTFTAGLSLFYLKLDLDQLLSSNSHIGDRIIFPSMLMLSFLSMLFHGNRNSRKLNKINNKINEFSPKSLVEKSFHRWLKFLVNSLQEGNMVLVKPSKGKIFLNELSLFLMRISYPGVLYSVFFFAAPISCPISLLVYYKKTLPAHQQTEDTVPSDAYDKTYDVAKLFLALGGYAAGFSSIYLQDTIHEKVGDTVSDEKQVVISIASLIGFAASMSIIKLMNIPSIRNATIGTMRETINVLTHPEVMFTQIITACPSWLNLCQRSQRNNDIEANYHHRPLLTELNSM
jgi:hypothetical protein